MFRCLKYLKNLKKWKVENMTLEQMMMYDCQCYCHDNEEMNTLVKEFNIQSSDCLFKVISEYRESDSLSLMQERLGLSKVLLTRLIDDYFKQLKQKKTHYKISQYARNHNQRKKYTMSILFDKILKTELKELILNDQLKKDSFLLKLLHKQNKELHIKKQLSIKNQSIDELDLSIRSTNCLKRSGINKIEELLFINDEQLDHIRNLSQKNKEEIIQAIKQIKENPLLEETDDYYDISISQGEYLNQGHLLMSEKTIDEIVEILYEFIFPFNEDNLLRDCNAFPSDIMTFFFSLGYYSLVDLFENRKKLNIVLKELGFVEENHYIERRLFDCESDFIFISKRLYNQLLNCDLSLDEVLFLLEKEKQYLDGIVNKCLTYVKGKKIDYEDIKEVLNDIDDVGDMSFLLKVFEEKEIVIIHNIEADKKALCTLCNYYKKEDFHELLDYLFNHDYFLENSSELYNYIVYDVDSSYYNEVRDAYEELELYETTPLN